MCVCWSLLHSSGVGRRRALQEIRDKRDATSLSFFPVQALPLQVPESPGLLRPGLKVSSLSVIPESPGLLSPGLKVSRLYAVISITLT